MIRHVLHNLHIDDLHALDTVQYCTYYATSDRCMRMFEVTPIVGDYTVRSPRYKYLIINPPAPLGPHVVYAVSLVALGVGGQLCHSGDF
jgi:hypothetical protein